MMRASVIDFGFIRRSMEHNKEKAGRPVSKLEVQEDSNLLTAVAAAANAALLSAPGRIRTYDRQIKSLLL